MKETATRLGFEFSRKGCPCTGTPLIYTITKTTSIYTLTIWEKRNIWKLMTSGATIARGNAENMEDKIKAIWDL